MTRNVMFCFLQNLTTSKKNQQNQLQASSNSKKISDGTLFGISKSDDVTKAKLKCENDKTDDSHCKVSAVNGKSKKKTTSKAKSFFLRKSRSSNSVSLSIRSASPSTDNKDQLNPVSSSQTSSLPVPTASNVGLGSNNTESDKKPTKRKSLSDSGNHTHSSIKHDLSSKEHPQPNTSTNSNVSNAVSVPQIMTSSTIDKSEASLAASSSTSSTKATQEHLQSNANLPENLSTASLYSSSVKSIANKSTDGASTVKKRKSLSSSRQKKFHRRFKQVAQDEELINYFSCAFVSDILLQGYLYITKNYIAFYSNVFGYVTKLLIPITSVAKISKEKTVKIIPNAIAVATIDERHVFSSFISREAAYQLLLSVWQEALPTSDISLTRRSAQLQVFSMPPEKSSANSSNESKLGGDFSVIEKMANATACTLQVVQQKRTSSNSGVSEIDDESSSAISGSEGLARLMQTQKPISAGEPQLNTNSSSSSNSNFNNISKSNCDFLVGRESTFGIDAKCLMDATNKATSTPKFTRPIAKSTSTELSTISFFKLHVPRTIHIAYFGLSLVIILALLAVFLFYRISEIKHTRLVTPFSVEDLNEGVPDANMYAEVLKWQKDMQAQRVHLTKNVLVNNLQQISQISESLQTLSSLIHTNEEHNQFNDKLSSIMGECNINNLESCITEQP